MAKIERQYEGSTGPAKPTMAKLKRDLVERCQSAGLDTGFAKYFWEEVCSPYRHQYEQPHVASVQGQQNQVRWLEPYRDRIMQCLEIYLTMSEHDRQTLHSGVEDHVHWKGEPMHQYIDICNETAKMRDIGVDAYREQVLKSIEKFNAREKKQ